jgi:hypothetical protein
MPFVTLWIMMFAVSTASHVTETCRPDLRRLEDITHLPIEESKNI